jgi:hypothetical protein
MNSINQRKSILFNWADQSKLGGSINNVLIVFWISLLLIFIFKFFKFSLQFLHFRVISGFLVISNVDFSNDSLFVSLYFLPIEFFGLLIQLFLPLFLQDDLFKFCFCSCQDRIIIELFIHFFEFFFSTNCDLELKLLMIIF